MDERAGGVRHGTDDAGYQCQTDEGLSNVNRRVNRVRAVAGLLVVAGFVSAAAAFFIAATRPPSNPWLLFVVGIGLTVVGIILIARPQK